MLKIRDLYVRYGGIEAVQGVSLDIKRGSIVTLVGANGAGKSSIIRSIAGLNKNISGEISLTRKEGDEPVSLIGLKPEEMVRRGISLSPEGRRILPHLTVVENLRLGAYSRTDKDGINEDIERVYALFPRLKERHWQKGGTLSGGEQQMLAVGRALMSRPDMIMLDEPSLGLAPLLVKEIFNIIRRINEDGYNPYVNAITEVNLTLPPEDGTSSAETSAAETSAPAETTTAQTTAASGNTPPAWLGG